MVAVFIVISVAFLISGRKKFLLYFVALYPVLPDYFGIELGVGLPLLKANRILLILLFIAVLIYYRNVDIFPKQRFINAKIYAGLLIYFSCRIIANAYYVTNLSEAINAEFTIIVEQFLLLVLLIQFIRDESELQEIIDIIVKVSGIIALVCFINIAIGENLFYYLKTIERSVMMTSTERMGIVRAEATFGHPVYYSVYTALMLPLALYLYQNKKKLKYLILMMMNIVALFLTGTRGTIVVLFIFVIIAFIRMERADKQKFAFLFVGLAMVLVILSLLNSELLKIFTSTVQSVMVAFGLSDAKIDNFGGNYETGLDSRLIQFSAFYYVFQNSPIFGLGAGCQNRGKLYYYVNDKWRISGTIDNGYVGYVAQEGLLGITAVVVFHFSLLKNSFQFARKEKQNKPNGMANMFFFCFLIYVGEMLSIADSSQLFWLIVAFYIAYNSIGNRQTTYLRGINQ